MEGSRVEPLSRASFSLESQGVLRILRSEIRNASGWLVGSSEGSEVLLADSRFAAPAGLTLEGAHAVARGSLFYNATAHAIMLADNATVEASTFVNNAVGVELGSYARLIGNELSFNQVAIRWSGGAGAVVQQNNIRDNFLDGVQGPTATQATLDASGNHWGGTPNVDGDGWSGNGISSASHAATPFPVPDARPWLPFAPLRVEADATWTGANRLDGPTIVRAGALTLQDAQLDAQGFPLGSRAGGRLVVRDSDVRGTSIVYSRSDDAFTGTTFRAPVAAGTGGILLLGGSATVRDNTFLDLPVAIVLMPRAIGQSPPAATLEGNTFDGCAVGALVVLAQPTLRGNTFLDNAVSILTVLATSVVVTDNLVQGGVLGIVSALDQGFTATGNSVYGVALGFVLIATTSPTVTTLEVRGNGIGFASLGAQVTLASSNVYDNPIFGLFAYDIVIPDPTTGSEVNAPGRIRVDPTTYAGDVDRGNVERVPPAKSTPSATPGRPALVPLDVVASGTTRALTGDVALDRPLIVRAGGTLDVRRANVSGGGHLVGALPGSRLVIENSTVQGLTALVVHTTDARIDDATFRDGAYYDLVLVESDAAAVRRSAFLGSSGVLIVDARPMLDRSLFDGGLNVVSTVPPRVQTHVRESFVNGRGVNVHGDAALRVEQVSLDGFGGVTDNAYGFLGSPAGPGTTSVDARDVWWRSLEGPSRPDTPRDAAMVDWPPGTAAVLYAPWLDAPFRASFHVGARVVTDADAVLFTDTSFDLDGRIASRSWDFGDGSPPSEEPSPTHTFSGHGERVVRLTVTDDRGERSFAKTTMSVKARPVAALWADAQGMSLDELAFDASGSTDADGSVVSYTFSFSDGATVGPQASPLARHAFARPGAHSVTLVARDDEGFASAPVTLPLTIHNRAPLAAISVTPLPATRVDDTLLASASVDLDGEIVRSTWDVGDGSAPREGPSISHRFAVLGTYLVTLAVTDDTGATATATREVTVANVAPTATLSIQPKFVRPGMTATFAATSADRDGRVVEHAWDFGDGATLVGAGGQVTHAYAEEGDYVVRLTVTDDEQASTTVERVLAVRWNFPPTAAFRVTQGGHDAAFGFRDESTDEDGSIASRRWDFGGTGSSTTANPAHIFREPGLHTVALTVTDDKGASAQATRTLLVDDVMTLAPRVETAGPTRDPVLHLRTQWLNTTGVPANYTVTVRLVTSSGHSVAWSSSAGSTDANGDAVVPLRGPAGSTLPGKYQLELRAQTRQGFGGNLETAGGTMLYLVGAS